MAMIEREAALKILHENPMGTWRGTPVYSAEIEAAIQGIEDLPSIDPIRAAGGCRCGECKHYSEFRTKRNKQLIRLCCRMGKNDMEYSVKPTDFCSYGKPREAQDDE